MNLIHGIVHPKVSPSLDKKCKMRSNQEDSDEDDAHNFTVEDFDRGDHPHDDQDPLDHTFYRDHVAISLSCDLVSQNMLAAMKLDKRPPASLRSRRKRMPM